jgi:hypothetical protein
MISNENKPADETDVAILNLFGYNSCIAMAETVFGAGD